MSAPVRLRAEFNVVVEYLAHPKDYDTDDPAVMVRMDQVSAEEDAYMFLDSGDAEWKVTVSHVSPDTGSSHEDHTKGPDAAR